MNDIQIHVVVNAYLLRCSLGSLIMEEFGNVSMFEKITNTQQLEGLLNNATGAFIIEDELLSLLPSTFTVPKFIDIIAVTPSNNVSKYKNWTKDSITLGDTKTDIVKKIDAIIHPKQNDEHSDSSLSEREKDVIRLVAKGYTNKEIADMLNLSIHTIISHRKNITAKLGIKTISGLSIYALLNGIIQSDEAVI
ncbi:MAG TPA: LuxR C-terminal-related transcriptional regulator [Bacteroidales bacterium]|nr:LuxR C-terminal-related transcriptional regulator [Bacteroidales bacterium]